MPAAKQQPLAAVIKAAARSCRSRHSQFPSNGKSPDAVPGGVDIAIASPNVSSCSLCKFTTQLVAGEKDLLGQSAVIASESNDVIPDTRSRPRDAQRPSR
jgi:hypothetical protein